MQQSWAYHNNDICYVIMLMAMAATSHEHGHDNDICYVIMLITRAAT